MRQLTNKVFIFEICSENHIQSDESPASENMIDFSSFSFTAKCAVLLISSKTLLLSPQITKQCTTYI